MHSTPTGALPGLSSYLPQCSVGRSQPDLPLHMLGLRPLCSKGFKRNSKSGSHFNCLTFLPSSHRVHTHTRAHTQLSSGFLSSGLRFSSWSWFMTFPRQTHWLCIFFLSRALSLSQTYTCMQHFLHSIFHFTPFLPFFILCVCVKRKGGQGGVKGSIS